MSKAERDSRQAADDQLEREEQGQGVAQVHLTSIVGENAVLPDKPVCQYSQV